MRFKYKMPNLSETASDFEILAWRVPEGAIVREGDPLVEVATDKATLEVPSPVTGRMVRYLVTPGQAVRAGIPIAELETV